MVQNQTVVDKLVEVSALLQQLDRKSNALRQLSADEQLELELRQLQDCLAEAQRTVKKIRTRCKSPAKP